MREIKFRAWCISQKEMIYPKNREDRDFIAWKIFIQPDEDYVGLEFTGLKDKNGKEIYEGDIVRYDIGAYKLIVSEVWFDHGMYKIKTDTLAWECGNSPITIEVIGNKFENPELLEVSE